MRARGGNPAVFGICAILILSSPVVFARRSFLTFIMWANTEECFYERVDLLKHTGFIDFEFTVLHGGAYDIELTVEDPEGRLYFNDERLETGTLNVTVSTSGLFKICFSNEFSYFSTKTVYFEVEVVEKHVVSELPELTDSKLLNPMHEIEDFLESALDEQWYLKNMELQGFGKAEQLNQRVQWAAALMTFGMLAVSLAQVYTLRRLFDDKVTLRRG